MQIYVERTDDGLLNQVDNFLLKAPTYPTLGLVAADLTALRKDWTLMKYVIGASTQLSNNASALVAYKQVLRFGGDLGAIPPLPTLAAAPPVTSGGMEKRFRDLIQNAVRSVNITDAIAQDLGIVATQARPSVDEAKPIFKMAYSSGGYPNIIWKKAAYEGVEIHKSKDGINFSKLDKDFKPDYTDKSDLPEAGKAEKWHYKLIYLLKDEQVGQWSDVQSIVVGG